MITKVENKIDEYKKENPGIFSWEIRERLVKGVVMLIMVLLVMVKVVKLVKVVKVKVVKVVMVLMMLLVMVKVVTLLGRAESD